MSNQLAGADKSTTRSIRGPEALFEQFDEWVQESDHSDRSKALRALMQDAMGGAPQSEVMPLQPPREEGLAGAYRRLCRSGYPDGMVRDSVAKRVAVRNHPDNLSAEDAMPVVLSELRHRGYLRRRSAHPAQHTPLVVWEIAGWDEGASDD